MARGDHQREERKPASTKAAEPQAAAADERHAVGHVMWLDGPNGFRSRRVRIPHSEIERYADGPVSPPDLRSNVAQRIQDDLMRDATLQELAREHRKP